MLDRKMVTPLLLAPISQSGDDDVVVTGVGMAFTLGRCRQMNRPIRPIETENANCPIWDCGFGDIMESSKWEND